MQLQPGAGIDARPLAQAGGDLLDQLELLHGVEIDGHAGLDGERELGLLLVAAVQHHAVRVAADLQGEVQLAEAEAVAAGAFLVEDAADGGVVVRLVGEEDGGARVAAAEGALHGAGVVADLLLGDDVEGGAEGIGQLTRVALLDAQSAVGVDRDGFGEVVAHGPGWRRDTGPRDRWQAGGRRSEVRGRRLRCSPATGHVPDADL